MICSSPRMVGKSLRLRPRAAFITTIALAAVPAACGGSTSDQTSGGGTSGSGALGTGATGAAGGLGGSSAAGGAGGDGGFGASYCNPPSVLDCPPQPPEPGGSCGSDPCVDLPQYCNYPDAPVYCEVECELGGTWKVDGCFPTTSDAGVDSDVPVDGAIADAAPD